MRNGCLKRLVSAILSLSLSIYVFSGYCVYAAPVTGSTEQILSFNFEDGSKTPAYTYEGSTYTSTTSNQVWTSQVTDDIWGKRFDRSLCLYSTTGAHSWFFATTKSTNSSLLDIGGGCAVVSFEMALKNTDTASTNFYIYYNRKDSGGSFAGKTLKLQFDTYGILLNTGDSLYNAYIVSGNVPREEWHSYDVVFVYGTNQLKVYRDGTLIGNLDSENVYGSGYTFAGLGQTDYGNMFAARIESGANGNTAYYDNFKVRRYSSAETFTPKFKENLSTATDNTLTTSGTYLNRTDGDFKVVTGAFGKGSADKSFKIVKTGSVSTGIKDNFYQKSNYGSGFQYGGKIHIGFNLAMDGDEPSFTKYLYLKPVNGTSQDVLYFTYNELRSGTESIAVTWEMKKWYKFDVYITPGDGTNVKNKMTVYMNGIKMFDNIELADKSFPGIEYLRIGQRERFISDDRSEEYNQLLYIDDVSFEYTPNGINVSYPNVSLSSNNSDIKILYGGTVVLYDTKTIAEVKAAVSSNVYLYAVTDEDTPVGDSESASDTYFLARATDDIRYIFPIIDKSEIYEEPVQKISEFDNIDFIDCNVYSITKGLWSVFTKTAVTPLTGKINVEYQGKIVTKKFEFDKPFMLDTVLSANNDGYAELTFQDYYTGTSDNKVILARVYNDKIVYLPEYNNVTENEASGHITAVIDPLERKVYIYSNDMVCAVSNVAVDDFDFDCAGFAVSAVSSAFSCEKFVLSANCSLDNNYMVFSPRFKFNGMDNMLAEAVVFNNSQVGRDVNLFLAKYKDGFLQGTERAYTILSNGNDIKHISSSESLNNLSSDEVVSAFLWENYTNKPVAQKINLYNEAKEYTAPSVPSKEEIAANLNRTHPRLLVTDFDTLTYNINNNSVYSSWYASVRNSANSAYSASMPQYADSDSLRLLSASKFKDRVMTMSFAYNINPADNTRYADRVWDYLVEAAQWPDWGYDNFIDTADMMMAYAFAYDWLYSYWTTEQKTLIKNTLKTKGLNYAYGSFNGDDYTYWLSNINNWSAWCNSSILVASLAIADEEEIAVPLIRCALERIQTCYACFAPDGAWKEGTGYAEAAMQRLAIALSSCETALKSDFGHRYAEGLADIGFYNLYMYGKDSALKLNDNSGLNNPYYNFYFGKLFDDKYLNGFRYYQLQTLNLQPTLFDLIWYDKNNVSLKFRTVLPYDKYYPGIQTVTMKDGFFAETNCFASLHAGYNNVSHGHLDGGTFEYETDGVRWAVDLGSDNYNLYHIFELNENSPKNRWCYYRYRAEGHNTWVINPSSSADQRVEGEGKITKYSLENSGTTWAVADLSNFYPGKVNSMNRGVSLDKSDGALIVRDEISLTAQSELYWFMHTNASVSISDDKKSAILTQTDSNGVERRLWVGITEGSGEIGVMAATPLPTSPDPNSWSQNLGNSGDQSNPKTQATNDGTQKLFIHYTGVSSVNQTVYMKRLGAGETVPQTLPQNIILADWGE